MCWVGNGLGESIAAQLALIYLNIEDGRSSACNESLDVRVFKRLLGAFDEGCGALSRLPEEEDSLTVAGSSKRPAGSLGRVRCDIAMLEIWLGARFAHRAAPRLEG
jgi:hypothetical protein